MRKTLFVSVVNSFPFASYTLPVFVLPLKLYELPAFTSVASSPLPPRLKMYPALISESFLAVLRTISPLFAQLVIVICSGIWGSNANDAIPLTYIYAVTLPSFLQPVISTSVGFDINEAIPLARPDAALLSSLSLFIKLAVKSALFVQFLIVTFPLL